MQCWTAYDKIGAWALGRDVVYSSTKFLLKYSLWEYISRSFTYLIYKAAWFAFSSSLGRLFHNRMCLGTMKSLWYSPYIFIFLNLSCLSYFCYLYTSYAYTVFIHCLLKLFLVDNLTASSHLVLNLLQYQSSQVILGHRLSRTFYIQAL